MRKLMILIVMILMGCGTRGGFEDEAKIRQAKSSLRVIRNAIQEYYVDHGEYPEEGANLKEVLDQYLSHSVVKEGHAVREPGLIVQEAKNRISQARSILGKCINIKELEKDMKLLEQILEGYERELATGEPYEDTLKTTFLVKRMQKTCESLKPERMKKILNDSLRQIFNTVLPFFKDMLDAAKQEDLKEVLQHIYDTYLVYKLKFEGKPTGELKVYTLENEFALLKKLVDEPIYDTLLKLNNLLLNTKKRKEYAELLISGKASLNAAYSILEALENSRDAIRHANKIVLAQAILNKMADALQDYRRKHGVFPGKSCDLEKILHPYFVETLISGEKVDHWDDAIKRFVAIPEYITDDSTRGFAMRAKVASIPNVEVSVTVQVTNKWDELVQAFSEGPLYFTPDPKKTYFLMARAKDSEGVIITDKPPREALQ